MKAEIIAVGTELLLGQIVNTNATFLAEELANVGIDLYYQSVVGDNEARLEELLSLAESRSDLVVLCGGLGPTKDDLTKQVVAKHVGKPLVQDEKGYQKLVDFFAKRNQEMTENNLLQALIIEGAIPLENETGLAVGMLYKDETTQTSYLLFPGPPNELKPMVYNHALPLIAKQFLQKDHLLSRVLRFYGIGESRLVTELEDLIEGQSNPTVAPYAKPNEVTLRLTVKTGSPKNGEVLLDQLEQTILARVGDYFYGYGDQNSLAKVVVDELSKRQQTLAVAESLTSGLVQATLGDISGVSEVFKGGVVVYTKQMKIDLLHLDETQLEQEGTVSEFCAYEMAQNIRKQSAADYGIALTGVAGPTSIEDKKVGTVYIGLATPEKTFVKELYIPRDRQSIRQNAVMAAFDLLRKEILRK